MKENQAQERVINEVYGQYIVIACPGSGKTTTLLRRINHMVKDEGIPSNEILMITFTKAVADEMKTRYREKYEDDSELTFCTIHSFCVAFLKKFDGFDPHNILQNNYSFIMQIIKRNEKHKSISNLESFTKDVVNEISFIKNNSLDIENYIPKSCDDEDFFKDIYCSYEEEKKNCEILDYDDILTRTYELMLSEPDTLDIMRDKFSFIHVDEYQDTNSIQRDIIYELAGLNGNITVVGDDDQSIYGFRGANPVVMQDFIRHYPSCVSIDMSINYRSDEKIISVASNLIGCNTVRFNKKIMAFSDEPGSVSVLQNGTRAESVMNISSTIMGMINNGTSPNSISVLYRTNSQAIAIADSLLKLDIPFYSNEVIPDKYQDDMFKDIVAYYKMAKGCTGDGMQEAFVRTITRPNRFFHNYNKMKYNDDVSTMKQKAYNMNLESWKNEQTAANIEKYKKMLAFLKLLKPEKFLDAVYIQCGYRKYLEEYSIYRKIPFEVLEDKWNSYKEDIIRLKINDFEEWLKYAKKCSFLLAERQKNHRGVCISTMHQSKGLEWDNVFIADCVEGMTPYAKAVTKESIEEERRLFYVAMTRSKHNLWLCAYKSKGIKRPAKISRFISECGL